MISQNNYKTDAAQQGAACAPVAGGCTVSIAFAAVLAALAVGLGAFGAHALKSQLLEAGMLETWKTAVDYQMWHALALLGLGVWVRLEPQCAKCARRAIAMLWVAGVVLFSGSLYALCLGAPKMVGVVTPFGGLAFIAGWLLLAMGAFRLLTPRRR